MPSKQAVCRICGPTGIVRNLKSWQCQTWRRGYLRGWFYNWSMEDYDNALIAQGNRCAICHEPPNQRNTLEGDHCHASGKQRKLLCGLCNNMLGRARDNPAILRAGADYLEAHPVN